MTPEERLALREHLLRWKRVGPLLEGIRRRELRERDFARDQQVIDGLLQMAVDHAKPARDRGLVHLHHFLRRLSREQGDR